MKIGILTVPYNNNYGGYLQSFALMSAIRKLGHDVILINRRPECDTSCFKHISGFIKHHILRDKTRLYNKKSMEKFYCLKGEKMIPFVNKHISPKTDSLYRINDYINLKKYKLDAVIVGSDQVWRPQYVPNIYEYFLECIPNNIRKIAYAASFGSDKLEYNTDVLNHCKDLLNFYRAVSVREKSGKDLLERYFGYKQAKVVLDPTMLLHKDDYLNIIGKVPTSASVFAYILDRTEEKEEIILHLGELYNNSVFDIMKIPKYAPYYSIEEWLNGINRAKIVITDSYHGTVFSILFNKPFYVINNYKRGNSRITDLLSMFNLNDRLISSANDIPHNNETIDWTNVNNRLSQLQNKSFDFLKRALS